MKLADHPPGSMDDKQSLIPEDSFLEERLERLSLSKACSAVVAGSAVPRAETFSPTTLKARNCTCKTEQPTARRAECQKNRKH